MGKYNRRWVHCPWISLFLMGLCPLPVQSLQGICEWKRQRADKDLKSLLCVESDISSGSCWKVALLVWSKTRMAQTSFAGTGAAPGKAMTSSAGKGMSTSITLQLAGDFRWQIPSQRCQKIQEMLNCCMSLPATLLQPWAEGLEKLNKL